MARRGYARSIEGSVSERARPPSPDSAAWAVAAAVRVALGHGSRGGGQPLPISAALGALAPNLGLEGSDAEMARRLGRSPCKVLNYQTP